MICTGRALKGHAYVMYWLETCDCPLRTDSGHLRDTPRAYVIPPIDRHMSIVCPLFVQAGEGHIIDSYNEGTGQT